MYIKNFKRKLQTFLSAHKAVSSEGKKYTLLLIKYYVKDLYT